MVVLTWVTGGPFGLFTHAICIFRGLAHVGPTSWSEEPQSRKLMQSFCWEILPTQITAFIRDKLLKSMGSVSQKHDCMSLLLCAFSHCSMETGSQNRKYGVLVGLEINSKPTNPNGVRSPRQFCGPWPGPRPWILLPKCPKITFPSTSKSAYLLVNHFGVSWELLVWDYWFVFQACSFWPA